MIFFLYIYTLECIKLIKALFQNMYILNKCSLKFYSSKYPWGVTVWPKILSSTTIFNIANIYIYMTFSHVADTVIQSDL